MSRYRPTPAWTVVGCFALIVLCWVLLVPPGGGADEPSHLTRSAAVIRGQTNGRPDPKATGSNQGEYFKVPARSQVPQPECYAFQPQIPVSCAEPVARTDGDVELISTSDEYPLWGHLVYGVGSLVPGIASVWPVRLIGALVAVALIGAALARTRSIIGQAAILVAATPAAVATIATVNPSAFAISGAIGCWVVLLGPGRQRLSRFDSWWFTASWAALILTRRDGIVWVSIIVVLTSLYRGRSGLAWFGRLTLPARIVVAATTLTMMLWGLTGGSRMSQMAAFGPLLVIVVDAVHSAWRRISGRRARAAACLAAVATVAAIGAIAVTRRPGGWDSNLARIVWIFADNHVVQAIGVFGWLDTTIPGLAVGAYLVILGVLGGAALAEQPRIAGWAAGIGGFAIVTMWWLEMMSGSDTGAYWQGRYSLPMLVGVPLVLGTLRLEPTKDRRVGLTAGAVALIVINVGAWAGARRWGVGLEGSLYPWSWDTIHQPVPPIALLVVMAAASTGLFWALSRSDVLRPRS